MVYENWMGCLACYFVGLFAGYVMGRIKKLETQKWGHYKKLTLSEELKQRYGIEVTPKNVAALKQAKKQYV